MVIIGAAALAFYARMIYGLWPVSLLIKEFMSPMFLQAILRYFPSFFFFFFCQLPPDNMVPKGKNKTINHFGLV